MAFAVILGEAMFVRGMIGTAYGEGGERTIRILRAKRINQFSVPGSRYLGCPCLYLLVIGKKQAGAASRFFTDPGAETEL
jgi:hypothetical protein